MVRKLSWSRQINSVMHTTKLIIFVKLNCWFCSLFMIPSNKRKLLPSFVLLLNSSFQTRLKNAPNQASQFFSYIYYWKWDYPSILKADLQAISLQIFVTYDQLIRWFHESRIYKYWRYLVTLFNLGFLYKKKIKNKGQHSFLWKEKIRFCRFEIREISEHVTWVLF